MATLEINGKQIEGKASFAFDRTAKSKYRGHDESGNPIEGFMHIFLGLLSFDTQSLLAFWDCALSHEEKRPSVSEIELALEKKIEKEGGTTPLIKDAFGVIDDSGFYKEAVKKFWDQLEGVKTAKGTKEEKAAQMQMYNLMHESKAILTASTTTK